MRAICRIPVLLVTLALGSDAIAGAVHVVDAAQSIPGSFATIQAAINVAASGDIVLVKPGNYPPGFVIDGRSLSIVADLDGSPPGSVVRAGFAEVKNIGVADHVLLRGLAFRTDAVAPWGARITASTGSVVIEDSILEPLASPFNPNLPTLRVESCARVMLTRCAIRATAIGSGPGSDWVPGTGLAVVQSHVFAYECTIQGGKGHAGFIHFPVVYPQLAAALPGGPAVMLYSGSFFASGSTIRGGDGGDGADANFQGLLLCVQGANGGAGIVVGGALRLLDDTITGGAPGTTTAMCAPGTAVSGPPIVVASGSITNYGETQRQVELSAPIREGGVASLAITGAPGEGYVLFLGVLPSVTFLPGVKGALFAAMPATPLSLGPLPAGGSLSLAIPLATGTLPPGIDGIEVSLQGHFAGSTASGVLSSASASVLIR